MAFRFPLATVLRVKESLEKREERELQRIQLEMARIAHQMEQLTEAMTKAYAVRNQALQQALPAGQLHTMLWEAQAAAEAKNALRVTLQGLEEQRLKQMKVYLAAHREHETIINLFNEQRDAYEVEQTRAQQKYLDDIFIARRQRG
jgi:flagellar export protein FliJ